MSAQDRINVELADGDLITWLADRAQRMGNTIGTRASLDLQSFRHLMTLELDRLRPKLAWMNCIADIVPDHVALQRALGAGGNLSRITRSAFELTTVPSRGHSLYSDKWLIGPDWILTEGNLLKWLDGLWPTADYALIDAVLRFRANGFTPTAEAWKAVGVTVIWAK